MSKHTILIVEDDQSIQSLLRIFFTARGFAVLITDRGSEAIELSRQTTPDLALLDVNLPDIDGYAVGTALRANSSTRHVPIVFLTARTQKADRLRALGEVGADYYLSKPFDIDEVQVIVERLIADSHAKQQAHPITGLPSSGLINERLRELLGQTNWALAQVQLDGFGALGTAAGEDLLRLVTGAIYDALDDSQAGTDFVGQLMTGPSFLVVSTPQRIQSICERLIAHFDESRAVAPPDGAPLRLAIGVLTSADGPFSDIRDLTEMLETVLKHGAEVGPGRRSFISYGHARAAGER